MPVRAIASIYTISTVSLQGYRELECQYLVGTKRIVTVTADVEPYGVSPTQPEGFPPAFSPSNHYIHQQVVNSSEDLREETWSRFALHSSFLACKEMGQTDIN